MRDYDPTTGRYIQADPLGLVDGASVYGYAGQNPGRYIDPRGEQYCGVTRLGKWLCDHVREPNREQRHCPVDPDAQIPPLPHIVYSEEKSPPFIDQDGAEHILDGHAHGAKPDKTQFPGDWTDDDIINGIEDVANNGKPIPGAETAPGNTVVGGTSSGVDIEVVIAPDGRIVTGYPVGGSGVYFP